MSTEQDRLRQMAERVARRVSGGGGASEADASPSESAGNVGSELAAMRASLEELQMRLVQIESHVTRKDNDSAAASQTNEQRGAQFPQSSANASRSPWLSGMYVPAAAHPSQERFGIEEATVSELVDFFEGEKKCELEPGGKPCDHCAMCSSRGF